MLNTGSNHKNLLGQVVHHQYRIESKIAQSSLCTIYRAIDQKTNKDVDYFQRHDCDKLGELFVETIYS